MFDTIKLEKSMYGISNKTFSQRLEELDPSENYIGTPYERLDAFERQLKRFDIKVSGEYCDVAEKFFTAAESAVLFPEFVRRAITAGTQETKANDVWAVVSISNSKKYHGASVAADPGSGYSTIQGGTVVSNGAITEDETGTTVTKYARQISTSYEFLRTQKLELLYVLLKDFGKKLINSAYQAVFTTIISGQTATAIAGTNLAYSDILNLLGQFTSYSMTTILAPPAVFNKIWALTELRDVTINENGKIILPFGTEIINVPQLTGNKLLAIDKNYALELIRSNDITVDVDKLISTQTDTISASLNLVGKVLVPAAVKVLNLA